MSGTIRNRYGKFGMIPSALVRDPRLSRTAKALYADLWSYADGAGEHAAPSRKTLSQDLGTGLSTLDRAVRELVDYGALVVTERWDGERRTTNDYTLQIIQGGVTHGEGEGVTSGEGLTQNDAGEGVKTDTPGGVKTGIEDQDVKDQDVNLSSEIPDRLPRPDVEALLDVFDDELRRNGVAPVKRTVRNRDAIRLMLDRDQRTPIQVENAIRWAQRDDFWRANILSPAKLREKYETLRLQAMNQRAGRRPTRTEENLDVVAQYAAAEQATPREVAS